MAFGLYAFVFLVTVVAPFTRADTIYTTLQPLSTQQAILPIEDMFGKEPPVLQDCPLTDRWSDLGKCFNCEFENCAKTCELQNCTDVVPPNFEDATSQCFKSIPNFGCNLDVSAILLQTFFPNNIKQNVDNHPKANCLYYCAQMRTTRCISKCNRSEKLDTLGITSDMIEACNNTLAAHASKMWPDLEMCIKERYNLLSLLPTVISVGSNLACHFWPNLPICSG